MEKTLNLVKNDPWLEPFAGAITGPIRDGLSVNGRPMLLIFIWWVHLIIGRKKQPIS